MIAMKSIIIINHSYKALLPIVLVVPLLVAACGSSSSSSSAATKSPIKVGMAVALTGYLANNDGPLTKGAELAAKDINSHGGVLGHPLQLIVENMASNPTQGVSVTTQLIRQDHVDALINGFTSAATAAETPIASAAQVPMVVASILPPDPTWVFSTIPPNTDSVNVTMAFAVNKLHAKTVGILYSETPFGEQAAKVLAAAATSNGIKVIGSVAVPTTATDLTSELSSVKGADVIIDSLTGPPHLAEARAAATIGLKTPIIMAIDNRSIFKQATSIYPDIYFVAAPPQVYPNIANPAVRAQAGTFIKLYKKTYGTSAGETYAGRGWDAIQILTKAMEKSHAFTGPKLRAALENLTYTGTSAVYEYSPSNHDNLVGNPYVIARYVNGVIEVAYR